MASKFLMAILFCAPACLPGLAQASIFSGSYQPTFYYDTNIFDQVQIASSAGNVFITDGAGPNDLNLQMSVDSKTVSVPLVMSGNVATLPQRSYDLGTATALDLILLSDGNNMVLAYVEQQKAGPVPTPISFAVSHWQRNPTVASADALIGNWQATSAYGDPNLRDTNNGFGPDGLSFTITKTADAFFAFDDNEILPLTVDGGRASLAAPPVTTALGVKHAFDMIYDNTGLGAVFFVTSELNDPTDVSVNVALVTRTPVPVPATWALFASGLALFALRVRRRVGSTT